MINQEHINNPVQHVMDKTKIIEILDHKLGNTWQQLAAHRGNSVSFKRTIIPMENRISKKLQVACSDMQAYVIKRLPVLNHTATLKSIKSCVYSGIISDKHGLATNMP